ncbi:MAG: SMC-Scp complex subunit ScpB [Ferrovibrio sp.]|uniref:SMC-Scp complex subunit ScpB n=1 Tax=Ferrovibrio sp. TaxID=1917215 RepID=UPI00391CE7D2
MQSNDALPVGEDRLEDEIEIAAAPGNAEEEDEILASAPAPKRDADDDDDDDDGDDESDDDDDDDSDDDDDFDEDDEDEDDDDDDDDDGDDEADNAVAEAPPAAPSRRRKAEAAAEDDDADDETAPAQTDEEREAAFAAAIRMAEALLFAAAEPLDEATLRKRLPKGTRVPAVLAALEDQYRPRGVNLKKVAGRWAFMTAPDLQHMLEEHRQVQRKLSRAAIETLAIIAYHQPCTRAEIEDIRGVSLSRGTLDVLMEANWVKVRGRRRVPGRPVTYGITDEFLVHFGLESADALPGIEELRASGLLEALPASGGIPMPGEALDTAPEDPLDDDDDGREFLEPLVDEGADARKAEAKASDGDA